MNRIEELFARRAREKRKVLIGYVTAGFPETNSLSGLVKGLAGAGLDLLEIGIPFSDPIADGPTIQHSSQVALQNGITLKEILAQVAVIRKTESLPMVFMSYSNPIYTMGIKTFFEAARASGVDGLIIPDLIPEESGRFDEAADACGIDLIYLVAPNTPKERIRRIAHKTKGFLYAVSLAGVTGTREELPQGLKPFLQLIKTLSPVPVAVGFGISTPAHARSVAPYCDGIIVGSALIKEIEKAHTQNGPQATQFIQTLRQALDETTGLRKETYAS